MINDTEAIGIVSMSFELKCSFIFVLTDNIGLINRISNLRPKAYICVFTDSAVTKNATSLNFGVYCFPRNSYGKAD